MRRPQSRRRGERPRGKVGAAHPAGRATGLAGDFGAAASLLDEIKASGLDDTATHARARLAIEAGVPGLAMGAVHMQATAASATDGPEAALAINERALAEIEGV